MNSAGEGYTNSNVSKEFKFVGLKWLKEEILAKMHKEYEKRDGLENISFKEWLSGQTIRESEIRALSTYPILTFPEHEIMNKVLDQMRIEVGSEKGRSLVKHNDSITPHIRPIVSEGTSDNVLPFVSNNKPVSAEGFRQAA